RPAGRGETLDHGAVLGDARAKALVSHVEERNQAAGGDGGDHVAPLRLGQIGAGRVVAAGVQHHDRAARHGLERGEHAVEIDAAGGRVVVGVVVDLETGAFKQGAVV